MIIKVASGTDAPLFATVASFHPTTSNDYMSGIDTSGPCGKLTYFQIHMSF